MLSSARVGAKGENPDDVFLRDLAEVLTDARQMLARN
jgi:hypothetical protein